MPDRPRISAAILKEGLPELLRARKAPALATLASLVDIPDEALTDDTKDISLVSYARLLDLIARTIGEDSLGLLLARRLPMGGTGVIGFLARHAPNMRASIEVIERFTPLLLDALQVELKVEKEFATIAFLLPESFPPPRRYLLEFAMGLVGCRLTEFYGDGWRFSRAEFEYREPASLEDYRSVFGNCLKFDSGHNLLVFRSEMLARPNRSSDERLFNTLRDLAEERLELIQRRREGVKGIHRQDSLSRIKDYIIAKIGSEKVDVEGAAAALEMDVHALQLELRRRSTSFGHELSRIRHRMAVRYLKETSLPMSEISELLGFSELSAFTRAAKGWFGMTPTAYRSGGPDADPLEDD